MSTCLSCPARAAVLLLTLATAATGQRIDREEREAAVVQISELLVEYYVFEDVAEECADHLYQQLDEGAYDSTGTSARFAEAVTRDLQSISKDRHLNVRPGTVRRTAPPDTGLEEVLDAEREDDLPPEEIAAMARRNFGFRRVEILDGNVGYLDLRGFNPASAAGDTAIAAMRFLSNADAIIIDLRQNGGGHPSMVELISSYFFAAGTQLNTLYDRVTDHRAESFCHEEVEGKRMLDLPLFVLTSKFTFSAAEAFTYNMKVRQRATIVGENTGGGAHAGDTHPVGERLTIFMPRYRAINPITGSNWEGDGVAPDVEAPADDALARALIECERRLTSSQ